MSTTNLTHDWPIERELLELGPDDWAAWCAEVAASQFSDPADRARIRATATHHIEHVSRNRRRDD